MEQKTKNSNDWKPNSVRLLSNIQSLFDLELHKEYATEKPPDWTKDVELWILSTWGKRFCFAGNTRRKFLGGGRKICLRL